MAFDLTKCEMPSEESGLCFGGHSKHANDHARQDFGERILLVLFVFILFSYTSSQPDLEFFVLRYILKGFRLQRLPDRMLLSCNMQLTICYQAISGSVQ